MITVYMMCSKMGPKTYVGSTSDLVKRKANHKSVITSNCASKILVEEYGWDNIIFTVLEECTVERRLECEQYWIDFVPNTVNVINAFTTEEERKAKYKAYLKANMEVRKEHDKAYYEANRDAYKEQAKVYYQANREAILEKRKAYKASKKTAM